jgi:hypothetical protein
VSVEFLAALATVTVPVVLMVLPAELLATLVFGAVPDVLVCVPVVCVVEGVVVEGVVTDAAVEGAVLVDDVFCASCDCGVLGV